MITQPMFYLVAALAVLITGISKGGFAGGLGMLAVPMMAIFMPPLQAASIMLPILCIMDVVGFWSWRDKWDRALMKTLLPAGLLGILIGTLLYHQLNDAVVKLITGLLAGGFSLNYWLQGRIRLPWKLPETVRGWFWGVLSGFTSFVSHAGGPPVMIYLLPKQLDKLRLVGTMTVLFAAINYAKLLPYALLGQLNSNNLLMAAILAPLAPIGVKLGIWLHERVSESLFYRLCYIFLLLTGIKLVWDGVTQLV